MELIDKKESAVAEYQPFYAQLVELEENNTKLVFDYESKKGNKEARSHVFKLRQTKGALEAVRKQVKADILVKGRAIDSEKAAIEERIEAMIQVHQVKLDEIEQREKDRTAGIQLRLSAIKDAVPMLETIGSEDLAAGIAELEGVAIDDTFSEFVADAAKAKDARLAYLRGHLVAVKVKEAEAKELARLRAEAAEREKIEREEAIARAAVEKAQAEAAAKADRERQEAVRQIAEAETRAKAEREAAERRELELKLAAEAAERRRLESEQRAEQERIDSIARAERVAKEAAERAEREAAEAVQREKDRVAAIMRAEEAEQAKREANKAHKAKINRAALAALVEGGLSEECAKQCITLIASGKVPAVAINY